MVWRLRCNDPITGTRGAHRRTAMRPQRRVPRSMRLSVRPPPLPHYETAFVRSHQVSGCWMRTAGNMWNRRLSLRHISRRSLNLWRNPFLSMVPPHHGLQPHARMLGLRLRRLLVIGVRYDWSTQWGARSRSLRWKRVRPLARRPCLITRQSSACARKCRRWCTT